MFGRHHVIGPTIGLAGDHRDHRHRRLAVGKQQFGPVFDHATIFLAGAGQKSGHIHQRQNRDFKCITEPDKPRGLATAVNVQTTGQHHRLIGHNANAAPFNADETGDDVLGEILLNFIEIAFVGQFEDQFLHVVRRVGVGRHQCVERRLHPARIIEKRAHGRLFAVVGRQEVNQTADFGQCLHIIFKSAVRHRGFARVSACPAQFFGSHDLVCHCFHHVGAGDEHVRSVFDHKDKVGHRGAVHSPARAGPHDQADLRDHAGGFDIALEHFGVSGKRGDTFLNTRPTGIVDANQRRAVLHSHILNFADFLGVGFRQRAAKHRKVLREHIDQPPVDCAPTRYHTIPRRLLFFHAKIGTAVGDEHVEFFETALIQQQINPLSGG